MPQMATANDCHGGMHSRKREHPEHTKHERHNDAGGDPGSDSQARLSRRASDRQVGDERIEVAIGSG